VPRRHELALWLCLYPHSVYVLYILCLIRLWQRSGALERRLEGQKPPSAGRENAALERRSIERSPRAWVEGQSPRAWVEKRSPRVWAKPPSVGRRAKPPSVGRRAKPPSVGEAPEHEHAQMSIHRVRNLDFIAWCRRHNIGRGLLPTPDYIVEGVKETALLAKDRSGATARRSMGSLRLSPFSGCVGGMPLPG
jgi:hypothetical protein